MPKSQQSWVPSRYATTQKNPRAADEAGLNEVDTDPSHLGCKTKCFKIRYGRDWRKCIQILNIHSSSEFSKPFFLLISKGCAALLKWRIQRHELGRFLMFSVYLKEPREPQELVLKPLGKYLWDKNEFKRQVLKNIKPKVIYISLLQSRYGLVTKLMNLSFGMRQIWPV